MSEVAVKPWSSRATEPRILFPAIAVVALAVIWGAALGLVRTARATAEHAAAVSAHELSETYEAQAVRALREIDRTLRFVKYAYELRGGHLVLPDLKRWWASPWCWARSWSTTSARPSSAA